MRPAHITILVDNKAAEGLVCEHGFSVWIETADRRVLFDTGQGGALAANSDSLGVDLRATDFVLLSHGHYDHTGGLPPALNLAPAAHVYLHPEATRTRYAVRDEAARSIGMPPATRAALDTLPNEAVHWTTQPLELGCGLGLTGQIPRRTDFEDAGGPFFVDAQGMDGDPIPDDQAMWFRTERGLVVVLGCGHAGLVNTLRQACVLSGEPRLHAVVGGFHLGEASDLRLERTVEVLLELAPDLVVPCHCTGNKATQALKAALGERARPGFAGMRLDFA